MDFEPGPVSMEETPPPPVNSSKIAFPFPLHRRRLRGPMYNSLIEIFALCGTNSGQFQAQVDSDTVKLRSPSEENEPCSRNEADPTDGVVSLSSSKESEDALLQETIIGQEKESIGVQDGGQATVPELDPVNMVKDDEQQVAPANGIDVGDLLMVENQTGDCASQIPKERENLDIILDIEMDDLATLEELGVDEEFSLCDFSEALNSCFGIDAVDGSSKAGEYCQENGTVLEENIPIEAEHELQPTGMELEKLLQNSGVLESSHCLNADKDIEDGEIPGATDAPLEECTQEMMLASKKFSDKEKVIHNEEDGVQSQQETCDPSPSNTVNMNIGRHSMTVESGTTVRQMQDCYSENIFHDIHMKAQRSGPVSPLMDNLTLNRSILQDNATENHTPGAIEKDDDAHNKKRKRGPLTEERKAKKKKGDRLRRAEKNRKLGVKRLKLQPILKPKTIPICRHYLQGRCQEGEGCKFSHDAVPLTKAKPCGHFARNVCMKGDDCPFDHQLSKYPCNNYTTNGFCNRGSDCLFSHEVPAKQSSSTVPNASKPESTSVQHTVTVKGGSSTVPNVKKPEVKFPSQLDKNVRSVGNSSGSGKPVQAPKGVSFLSNGRPSPGDTSKHKQDKSPTGKSDSVDVTCKANLKTPGSANKPNNNNNPSDGVAPKKPRGINFLSFARPASDGFTSGPFSNLLSSSEGACSLPQSVGMLKVDGTDGLHDTTKRPSLSFDWLRGESTGGRNATTSPSSNTPSSVQKAVQSTLAYAAKFESGIKVGPSIYQQKS